MTATSAGARTRRRATAVACVADNLDALLVHLLFPTEHRKRIRHSNLIERTFGETRRERVKVIGRLPAEQSCLSAWSGRCLTGRPRAGVGSP